MITNYEYHPDGAGCQRFDEEDYVSPPKTIFPQRRSLVFGISMQMNGQMNGILMPTMPNLPPMK